MLFIVPSPAELTSSFDFSSTFERLLIIDPISHIAILRDFRFHNHEWLVHSDTSIMGHQAEQFAVVNNLCQVTDPAHIPDKTGVRAHILDFIPTLVFSPYSSTYILSPLGLSDYCVITSSVNFTNHNSHPPQDRHLELQFGKTEAISVTF